jgi:hypothetical protein
MCLAKPKAPPPPPPPAPPPIKMTERIRPSMARRKSRNAATESTSALTIPLTGTKADVGPGMPY